ncbi:ATP-binding protein [Sphingomonas sp. R1]|uniref:ATP-binding protein n=1 Tax=Sphingomonas sp. R1 TaxID=399176 RepID=UPI0022250D9E|nr:ATP-binding protein [Sphingomonas sp. R1]UYY77414.1 ATP-binding protein [Sphingomonas sp. R1]
MMLFAITSAAVVMLVQFAMVFRGPPPGFGPVPIARIADALRTGHAPVTAHGQTLILRFSEGDRFGRSEERAFPDRDRAIAGLIPVPADQIRGYYEWPVHDPDQDIHGSFSIGRRTEKGWLVASVSRAPGLGRWRIAILQWMLVTLVILSLLAWAAARRISRPIRRLAEAAKRARLGAPEAIPLQGPREIRDLGKAMEAMQTRILQQAENRTVMLAAMAHDLGTPLSRLAFWIEQLPDAARDRAVADIDEMRAMLAATLRFTRDDRAHGEMVRLDLGSVIESLVDDLGAAGNAVTVDPGPRMVLVGDAQALRRLFGNLVENALRYGRAAEIWWAVEDGHGEILVDDKGPGFDPSRAEKLFAPFVRGESSRNRATGGTGLGLAIVRSIVELHGGEVMLENRPGGAGGRVRVRLPLAN